MEPSVADFTWWRTVRNRWPYTRVADLKDVVHHKEDGKKWITNRYSAHNLGAIKSGWCDTAADALCKLALQLKNEGLI